MRPACALLLPLLAAASPAPPQNSPAEDNHVIRIDVDEVQVDAVVTDRHGRQVTDLGPSDFKVFVDRRPRKITAVNYIRLDAGAPPPVAPPKKKRAQQDPTPPSRAAPLRRQDVRRTLVLLIDDLNMSFQSVASVRQTLKKFIETQLLPGDLVAIQLTSGGAGFLQQFTNEKRQLLADVESLHWLPSGVAWIPPFRPGTAPEAPPIATFPPRDSPQSAENREDGLAAALRRDEMELDNLFMTGTLGALRFTIQGLRDLPGRKAVVLFSDGLSLDLDAIQSGEMRDAVRALTDLASRSAVVLFTVDTLGLPVLEPGASAAVLDERGFGGRGLLNGPGGYFASKDGLAYLASQTGGEFIHDTNDLNHGLGRVMDDLGGYYLVAFQPDPSDFKGKTNKDDFHRIRLVANRPGLRVRSRSGFLGIPDAQFASASPDDTPGQRLISAIDSPFVLNTLPVRLSSYFQYERGTAFVRNFLHVDAHAIHFTPAPGGFHDASLHVALFAFGTGGTVLERFARQFPLHVAAAEFPHGLAMGAVLMFDMPVSQSGGFQMRAAVLDDATGNLGSASQFLTIPNLRKGFALSSVVIGDEDTAQLSDAAAAGASPVLRMFPPGSVVEIACNLLHPTADPKTHLADVRTQWELYRDGQRIFAGPLATVQADPWASGGILNVGSRMKLGASLAPGHYVLQLVAADLLAKKKQLREAVAQWVDFEITAAAVSTPPH